jgi:hypothetical protein
MLSYHNDPAIKEKYVKRFAQHRAADAVIQGTGYEKGRGCFVGCTLESYQHSRFPIELGWPEWLAHLADRIFEELPESQAPQFGTDLLDCVPVGVDLEPVKWQLAIWRHENQLKALENNTEPYTEKCRSAITQVVEYCRSMLDKKFDSESATRAAEAAQAAARSAAAAADSAAQAAAWSALAAAWSAAAAADSAARSAAWSAAESAAESAHWQSERDMLLKLVKELGHD